MKTQIANDLSADLDELQDHLRQIDTIEGQLKECLCDADSLQAQREKAGAIRYGDEKGVLASVTLDQRISLCNAQREKLEAALIDARQALLLCLQPKADRASRILWGILKRRVETISAVIRPFCNSDHLAESLARKTSCYHEGELAAQRLATVSRPERAVHTARQVIAILRESSAKDGDLMQFLSPSREDRVGETSSAGAAAR